MALVTDKQEIDRLYKEAKSQSEQWREDYHEFERLADNDLLEDLDPTLPETNDGTLSASLFKLPKRIISSNLTGRAKATNRDDAWLTELANMQWENEIIPNANSQAPFHRKWKDAVRKAAIYGSVPLITLFVERGDYTGADFIVAQPQDVILEPGKVSDYDSDIVFWEVYYTKSQVKDLLKQAQSETKAATKSEEEAYNTWDVDAIKEIVDNPDMSEREPDDDHRARNDKSVKQEGVKFCIVFQRGVDAPFYMYHKKSQKTVRTWTNPDPTGDIPVHFLYCYQDFVNPYGIGIAKLAGGTQNVLDYMRQADVLATQLGFRPPVSVSGDVDSADLDTIIYEQDAIWEVGNATVQRQEISNQIYSQLPNRISMYKTSLNQLIPVGDTSIAAGTGDPNYSKTPAGVKFQQANLSIDDEDFKDNVYMTYEAVAKSMLNTHFANMQGRDLMKLSDEERDILMQAGLEFPLDEEGNPSNEVDIIWDEVRANFDFEIEAENDQAKDEEKRLEGLLKVLELIQSVDPALLDQELAQSKKRLMRGELLAEIINLTTENDKIVVDISPDEMAEQEMMAEEEATEVPPNPEAEQEQMNLQAVMEQYGVEEGEAMAMLEAEKQGYAPEEIVAALKRKKMREMANVG